MSTLTLCQRTKHLNWNCVVWLVIWIGLISNDFWLDIEITWMMWNLSSSSFETLKTQLNLSRVTQDKRSSQVQNFRGSTNTGSRMMFHQLTNSFSSSRGQSKTPFSPVVSMTYCVIRVDPLKILEALEWIQFGSGATQFPVQVWAPRNRVDLWRPLLQNLLGLTWLDLKLHIDMASLTTFKVFQTSYTHSHN